MKKIALTTFGCRANQYDGAFLAKMFRDEQCEVVGFNEEADVYVINSCSITGEADIEARQHIHKAKRNNPNAITLLTGCSAEASTDKFKDVEGLHYIVGNLTKENVLTVLNQNEKPQAPVILKSEGLKDSSLFFGGGLTLDNHSRSFLKIQDGCSQFCSFCIVPYSRGLNRSVLPDTVMESLHKLNEQKVEEVVLTGIHLGTYGKDLDTKTTLMDLLYRIEREKPVKRVRLSSVDPEEFTDEMIDFFASSQVFCPHVHLPLQSGDDGVLKSMKRRYTAQVFRDLTHKLKERIPHICIGTDVIVGFPGETEEAFQNTYNLINETPVTYVHTFPYSVRQGTKAASFPDQIDLKTRKKRAKVIRLLSEAKKAAFTQNFVGEVRPAILEKHKFSAKALTDNYISVELMGPLWHEFGKTVPVKLTRFTATGMRGEIDKSAFY
ncbi:tRNA (N(6)-L-threonylcarbamoyladenosine(37)-C(2))-methylthiotransferase MtaB [bacterium]|nr:tRNA (N(6)-L-threonylcarbamoyladenosine(37)-C(2))-methylthiotransferase MtaB [bacterium]